LKQSEIFQAQHFVIVIVGEDLGVAAPVDHGIEHALGLLLGQVILEFAQEAGGRRAVPRTLVEDAANMG
jgi:hypothetical protein